VHFVDDKSSLLAVTVFHMGILLWRELYLNPSGVDLRGTNRTLSLLLLFFVRNSEVRFKENSTS
jgi:hypothetical protein